MGEENLVGTPREKAWPTSATGVTKLVLPDPLRRDGFSRLSREISISSLWSTVKGNSGY